MAAGVVGAGGGCGGGASDWVARPDGFTVEPEGSLPVVAVTGWWVMLLAEGLGYVSAAATKSAAAPATGAVEVVAACCCTSTAAVG